MATRSSSRSLKRVNYSGLEEEEAEQPPTRSATRPRKRRKPDADFSADVSDTEDVFIHGTKAIPHSKASHGAQNVSPLLDPLLAWYDTKKNARGMPWRKGYDPTLSDADKSQRAYEVFVSEMMLQQTQASPYRRNETGQCSFLRVGGDRDTILQYMDDNVSNNL